MKRPRIFDSWGLLRGPTTGHLSLNPTPLKLPTLSITFNNTILSKTPLGYPHSLCTTSLTWNPCLVDVQTATGSLQVPTFVAQTPSMLYLSLHPLGCSTDFQSLRMTSEKNGWRTQEEEYLLGADSSQDEPPSYNSIAPVPSHNLGHIEVQREKELAMMEKFCDWREIWYKTITKCTLSKLLCEPKGMNKLRTHGLAIWVSRRADYGNLDDSKAYLHERAPRNEWTWNEDWWAEATAFKVRATASLQFHHFAIC